MLRSRVAPIAVLVLVLAAACSPSDDGDSGAAAQASSVPEVVREVSPSVVAVVDASGSGGGSGVVIDGDGAIVTNAHVAEEIDELEVVLGNGERLPAQLVASDPLSDLAVLRVDRQGLPAASFADDLPDVGEIAIAVGNPLGLESSVTQGIVSGLQRDLPVPVGDGGQALVDLIQTDAAISPGNSGGALADQRGEIIGITVAYIPPQLGAVSLGFAIPAATVVDVATQLAEEGEVRHAYLGVVPSPVTAELSERFDLGVDDGVLAVEVVPGGPADDAGLRPGDVIVAVDDEETPTMGAFLRALRAHEPGDEVTIGVVRDGDEQELAVTLSERPESQ